MGEPVIQFVLGFQNGADNINDAEMRAMGNFDVSCVLKLWKDKPTFSFNQKVNGRHIIAFEENVLIFRKRSGFQQRTHVGDKCRRSPLKAMDSLVRMLMDVQGHLKLQLVRKLQDKLVDIFLIFVAVVLHDLLHPLVKFQGQHVILVDSVQHGDPFLQLGVRLIVVLQDGRQRAGRKREGHHTDKHDEDTHRSFDCVLTGNITVAYRRDGTDREIKGSEI